MASAVALSLYAKRPKPPPPPPPVVEELPEALVVFCFQSNQRSEKCEKIEQRMQALLKKSFAKQLDSGQMRWRVVYFEDPDNAHFVDRYKLTATTIVVDDGRPGNAGVAFNYKEKAWALVDDDEKFDDYFRAEIERILK